MKFDLTNVRYSNRDKEKGIIIPKFLTEKLAEDIGIHVGDGGLHYCNRNKTSTMFEYSGNVNDTNHMDHILNLKKRLYNLNKVRRYR